MKQFIVIEATALNNHKRRALTGFTYNETALRELANNWWNTPLDASFKDIATVAHKSGFMVFQYVPPKKKV